MTRAQQRWMFGGDVNQGVESARRAIGAPHSFGAPPMGVFWGAGWDIDPSTKSYVHADHKILRLKSGDTLIAVVNCTYQWGGDSQLLNKVAEWADVILMVECRTRNNKPLKVKSFIGDTHRVRQDLSNSARSGSAIAVRKDPNLILRGSSLSLLSPKGHDVQPRHLRTVNLLDHGVPTRFGAGHLGLGATGVQDDGERTLKRWVAQSEAR